MPETTIDWDESVTNVAAPETAAMSEPPNTGPGDVEPGAEGVESVATGGTEMAAAPPPMSSGLPELTELRPIGEASYGALDEVLETVHGEDNRVRITGTGAYPWRVHASLRITAADGSMWIGTGWFTGPRTLITAGHVVYIASNQVPARRGWVRRIEVIPGRNEATRPFGSAVSGRFHSVRGWTENGDPEYDYGAIVLDEPLGDQTGWFAYGAFTDDDLMAAHANISGYPGDKPDGTQWYDHRRIDSVSARKVFYDIDTFGGQSGSAVYRFIDGNRFAVGIHAYGGAVTNSATRITARRFQNLEAWNDV
jgi:glutamyl endopeptidase